MPLASQYNAGNITVSRQMAEDNNIADSAVGVAALMVTKIEATSCMQVIKDPGCLVSVLQPHG